jgi:uncharacterized membrane protein YkoI
MKNKKLPMFVLGALLLGAGGSIAVQTFAQTATPVQPSAVVSNQTVDQKDAQGNDMETNDDNNDVVSASVLAQVKISESQARQIVLSANQNTTIKTIVVGDEDGKAIYEVELSNNTEVKIDAVNGSILKADKEEMDGEDNHVDQKDSKGNDVETNDGNEQED